MEAITLSLSGVDKFSERVTGMRGRLEDLSPAFEFMHELWLQEIRQQFLTQGALFLGEQWAPLNPAYAERKLALYGPPPETFGILYRTGRLVDSLSREDHEDHVKVITPEAATFGTSVEYAKYHQAGTKKMPQRLIIKVRERLKRNFFRTALLYIMKGRVPGQGETQE